MSAPDAAVAEMAPPQVNEVLSLSERQMEVGELPGQSFILDVQSLGRDVWQVFKKNPDLPGIIFARESAFAGMVSSTQFLKIMSRPFGREIFEGRSVSLLLKELVSEPLILNHRLDIQSAIESCLQRTKDLIYEPFLVVNPEKNLIKVCTVQVLMHASAQAAILRNRQMEQILGTVTDGLLLVDRDFRIGSEHSRALEKILGRNDVPGKLFTDVLAPLLPPQVLPQAVEYLQVLFDKKLIDRLIKSINPIREVTVTIPDAADPRRRSVKHLTFDFERIHNRGEINQILVRIEDVSRRVNLTRELEQREAVAEQRMKLMLQIVAAEPGGLKAFLTSCEREVSSALQTVRTPGPSDPWDTVLESIFRSIHRLKGDAALLHLGLYKDSLHRLEDVLDKLRASDSSPENLALLESGLEEILDSVKEARSILEQFSKWNIEPPPIPPSAPPALIPQISGLVEEMSARLGKQASLHAMIDETLLPPPYRELLKDALVQLIRNSMAHGIESAAVREQSGKPTVGILQIALEKNPDNFEIIFQDDGAGLNWEKIRHRAENLDLPASDEESLKNALFTAGFSTAEQVTEDCGRGVGLDLIRTRILAFGGSIAVHSEQGSYCAFQIFLPLHQGGES